jgi:3-hydroxyisobutyrate dehydrogenase
MAENTALKPAVALLGTGIMGAGMGRSMLRAGLPVHAWNRTSSKARQLAEAGAEVPDTAAEAVRGADVIVTMLADAQAVTAAVTAAKPGIAAGQLWLQTSTVGVAGCGELARLADELGLVFVDCPVLGSKEPAEHGALTVLAAGPEEARPAAQPVFEAIGQRTIWLEQPGQASRLKLVVNSWVLALTTAVAEAVALAEGLGADATKFLEAVSGGPLDCGYLRAKAAAILQHQLDANFSVAMAAKDARLVAEAGAATGVRLDVASAVAERMARAARLGHAGQDMAATYFASFDG